MDYYFFVFDARSNTVRYEPMPLVRNLVDEVLKRHGDEIGCSDGDVWNFWVDGEILCTRPRFLRVGVVPAARLAQWKQADSYRTVDRKTLWQLAVEGYGIRRKNRPWEPKHRHRTYRWWYPAQLSSKRWARNVSIIKEMDRDYPEIRSVLRLKKERNSRISKEVDDSRWSRMVKVSHCWKDQGKKTNQYKLGG